jgi:hypothetical protein
VYPSKVLFSSLVSRSLYGLYHYLFLHTYYKTFEDLGTRNFYDGQVTSRLSSSRKEKRLLYNDAVSSNLNRLILHGTRKLEPIAEEKTRRLGFELTNAVAHNDAYRVLDNFFYVELSTSRKLVGSQRSVLGLVKLANHNYDFYSTVFTDFKYTNAYRTELQLSRATGLNPLFMSAHGQAPERLKRVLFGSDDRADDRYFDLRRSPKPKTPPVAAGLCLPYPAIATLGTTSGDYKTTKEAFTWATRRQVRRLQWGAVTSFFRTTKYFKAAKKT